WREVVSVFRQFLGFFRDVQGDQELLTVAHFLRSLDGGLELLEIPLGKPETFLRHMEVEPREQGPTEHWLHGLMRLQWFYQQLTSLVTEANGFDSLRSGMVQSLSFW